MNFNNIKNLQSCKVVKMIKNSYTCNMKNKKINLADLFKIDDHEPLILNVNDMNFEERDLFFDKLYQDYIDLLDEPETPHHVSRNYARLLKELSKYYFH